MEMRQRRIVRGIRRGYDTLVANKTVCRDVADELVQQLAEKVEDEGYEYTSSSEVFRTAERAVEQECSQPSGSLSKRQRTEESEESKIPSEHRISLNCASDDPNLIT